MLYCVNGLTVHWFLIAVLAILRKITDLIRKLNQIWIELDNYDPRFDLDCGGHQLPEDTLANDDQLHAPVRSFANKDKFTQVDFLGSRFHPRTCSRKAAWTRPTFHPEYVAADRFGFPPPPLPLPVRNVDTATYATSSPVMYVTWQPRPRPPKPEYYVGPAWFDVNGPPPLPRWVAASRFTYPPSPMRR